MAGTATKATILANLTAGSQPLSLIDGDLDPLYTALVSLNTYGNYYTDAGSANAIAVTINSPQTFSLSGGGLMLQIKAAAANTGATTVAINGGATKNLLLPSGGALPANAILANGLYNIVYDGTSWYLLGGAGTIPRSYLAGLTMSTAGSSATMTVAAGMAADSGNAALVSLGSSIGKTTSAWAVGSGNGGLDTGAIANTTWYYFFLIQRTDTGVTDVLFSLSATAPTMPTNYTLKRRIGAGKTNGSAQWVLFHQQGDEFLWDASVLDVNTNNPGTSAVTATLASVPSVASDIVAIINPQFSFGATGTMGLITALDESDQTPSTSAAPLATNGSAANTTHQRGRMYVRANSSGQIRYRVDGSDGSVNARIATVGWVDRRGRDA